MGDKIIPEKNSTNTTSRRNALKALGSGAIVGSGLLTSTAAAKPATVEVPELLSGDTVVEYMQVPKDWYQHTKHARQAKNELADRIRDLPSVFSVALVGQDATFGGKPGLKIRVQIDQRSEPPADGRIPDRVDGIPVSRQPAPASHGPAGCYNSGDESNVSGGEVVGWENGGYGTATGTIVHDPSGSQDKRVLHCAHVFWSSCDDAKSGNIIGRTAERGYGSGSVDIGTVSNYNRKGDYVFINNDGTGSDFFRSIDENDSYPSIAGCISQTKINSMASTSGETVYNMGATTGKTSGQIVASDKSFTFNCMNFHDEGVEATANFADGDSGGPTYIVRNGDAYISHVSSYRYYDRKSTTTCSGNTVQKGNPVGQSAYWIQNNENIKFGSKL